MLFTHAIAISSVAGGCRIGLTSRCDRVIAAGISLYEDPYAISTSTPSP